MNILNSFCAFIELLATKRKRSDFDSESGSDWEDKKEDAVAAEVAQPASPDSKPVEDIGSPLDQDPEDLPEENQVKNSLKDQKLSSKN